MSKMHTIDRLLDPGVIAIVRARRSSSIDDVGSALLAGGITAIEVTLTTPGAIESIRMLSNDVRTKMVIGVGTVLDPATAREAIEAGARFVVTPILRPDVVRVCREMGVTVMCGAFSPTEAFAAHEAGADFVKLFPADAVGPEYVKALLAPFPTLRIVPTGGVTPETCGAFLKAGCVAVGAGSSLVSAEVLGSGNWTLLTERAREFVEAAKKARA